MTKIVKKRIKRMKKEANPNVEEPVVERTMKYYITQTGKDLLEGYKAGDYKKAEDVAAEKVKKRVAKARKAGKKISPSQEGRRLGVATYYAGREAIRRS